MVDIFKIEKVFHRIEKAFHRIEKAFRRIYWTGINAMVKILAQSLNKIPNELLIQ